jgi:excisionase family DNA binding protein
MSDATTRHPKRGPRPKPASTGGAFTIYNVSQAARELGQSRKTVDRLIAAGLLPARRLGGTVVVLKVDLERFLHELPTLTSVDAALGRIVARTQAAGDVVEPRA